MRIALEPEDATAIAEQVVDMLRSELESLRGSIPEPVVRLPRVTEKVTPIWDRLYLTEAQVADMTGISRAKLASDRSRRDGFPYRKVGKCIRYRREDVLRGMENGAVETR